MKARVLYRISAVLILLFAVGHLATFPWSDPAWKVDLTAMRSSHFQALGFTRTYWDFYVGFGLIEGVLLLAAAVHTWQFGGLPAPLVRRSTLVLAACFAALTILSCVYFFAIPIVFSALITVSLVASTLSRL